MEQQQLLHEMSFSEIIHIIDCKDPIFSKIYAKNGLHIIHHTELDYYTFIHYNENKIEDFCHSIVYLLSGYQPSSTRLLEIETASQIQTLWKPDAKMYAIGIGYGTLTMLQTLPYCRKEYFENGKIISLNPIIENQITVTGYDIVSQGWNMFSFIPSDTPLLSKLNTFLYQRETYSTNFLRSVIDEYSDDGSFATILRELEEKVFYHLLDPLKYLGDQKYQNIEDFRLDKRLHKTIENEVENLRERKGARADYYLELALKLLDILKKDHSKSDAFYFKNTVTITTTTVPIFAD